MRYREFAPGVAALLLAAAIGALIPILFGMPRPRVHVTWRGVPEPERVRLEEKFALSEPTAMGEGEWSYVPLDTSPDTLRALVRLDSVATTDGIDRAAFRVSRRGPLTARRGGLLTGAPAVAARASKLAMFVLGLLGMLLLVRAAVSRPGSQPSLLAAARARLSRPRATASALAEWLARGVPVVSPQSLAAFRLVFGGLVTAYVWSEPVYPALLDAYELGAARGLYGAIVRALAQQPALVDAVQFGVLASGIAFAAGLRPRASFAVFAAFVIAWACVLTLRTTSHVVSALLLTMVALLPARWGDAWSLDGLLRRTRSRSSETSDAVSGFPLWIPAFVLGVTFVAAAWAKLQNGLGWILNGTVKYHFVSDMHHAWVDWGVRMTESHAVAVALSAGAVLVEALVITAAFSRSDGYRLAFGLASAALLAGFALFQGVVWLGWWILLVAFIPWRRVAHPRGFALTERVRLRPAELLAVLFVVGQQLYVSARHVEARPLFTAYDMYSSTYNSREDYEAASNLIYRVVAIVGREAADLPGCVVDDRAARAIEAAARGDEHARVRFRALIGPCLRQRPDVTMVRLEGDRRVYNWEQRRFEWRRRLEVVGPVRVDWIHQ